MKKICFFSLLLAFFLNAVFSLSAISILAQESTQKSGDDVKDSADGWISMPAGAKPAYLGIHGGTMPVSLLVSGDGSSLFTFVGRTGNDFLEVLRKAYLPLPSFGNATTSKVLGKMPSAGLFAGNATTTMPVIAISGDVLSRVGWLDHLQPFGLSEEPLSIEGEVVLPTALSPVKRYRIFSLPDYFQPMRK